MNDDKNIKYRKAEKATKRSFSQNVSVMLSNFVWNLRHAAVNCIPGIGNALLVIGPFVMLFVGEYVYADRGYWATGGEVALPFLFVIVGLALKSYAKVSGTDHSDIPVPYHRFTDVNYENGQVDVENRRLQEMILYMADLEDWFDRNGYHE